MAERERPMYGALGEFGSPAELYRACEKVRDAGYARWDTHTPFPVHGLERAMGLKPSRLPFIVLFMAFAGMGGAFLLQAWIHAIDYPLVISGKPFMSWQAFIPVVFEVTILFSAIGAFIGLLHLTRLPRHYHSLFRSDRFVQRASDDGFFIAIEVADPKFDLEGTQGFLREIGATHVEMVED